MTKHNLVTAKAVDYTIRTVSAVKGGDFITTGEFIVGDLPGAKRNADNLQEEHDNDCSPCRVYVHSSKDPAIPIYAGLQMREYGGYRGRSNRKA